MWTVTGPPDSANYHDVDICKGTLMARVLDRRPLRQRICTRLSRWTRAGARLPPAGLTIDSPILVEAMESETASWALAVQWHPKFPPNSTRGTGGCSASSWLRQPAVC